MFVCGWRGYEGEGEGDIGYQFSTLLFSLERCFLATILQPIFHYIINYSVTLSTDIS